MGNIFTKALDKDDKKKGLFKRPKNIKDKNKELLNTFSKAAKNESDFNYDSRYIFTNLTETLKNLKECH